MTRAPSLGTKARKRRPAKRTVDPSAAVRKVLRDYANRGVFRSFSESDQRGGIAEFKFIWLSDIPINLRWNRRTSTLTFFDFLPEIPARSAMYSDLKDFVRARTSPKVPAHRRIDPRRAQVGYTNRGGNVSIRLKVKGTDYRYGANRAINLISEIYMGFLHNRYYDYLVQNFGVPDE